jgi:hypothetical protein
MKTCDDCRYFWRNSEDSEYGECCIRPPNDHEDGRYSGVIAETEVDRPACSEFAAKDDGMEWLAAHRRWGIGVNGDQAAAEINGTIGAGSTVAEAIASLRAKLEDKP